MKSPMIIVCLLVFSIFCTNAYAQEKDPVKQAGAANEKKADKNMIDEEISDFLVKSADARMMDAQEGKLAARNGTSANIRNYGVLMEKDQALLLQKIKALAVSRNISLPAAISHKKENGREELARETGDDFDKKFIKMMRIDPVLCNGAPKL